MSQLREVEYNAFTGEKKEWYFDGDSIICKKSVDLTDLIDNCKLHEAQISGFSNRRTKFHKVASLPPIVIENIMRDHKLDVFSSEPSEQRRLEKVIEQEYPYLKTNSSKLWRPT